MMVFSLVTLFVYSRVAMFRAPLRFGILEAEKASPGSKPFTALMHDLSGTMVHAKNHNAEVVFARGSLYKQVFYKVSHKS
jgi:hypothetical protein